MPVKRMISKIKDFKAFAELCSLALAGFFGSGFKNGHPGVGQRLGFNDIH